MSDNITTWREWEIVRTLGSGAFGTVYEIRRDLYDVSEMAALKVIPVPPDMDTLNDLYGSSLDPAAIEEWCQQRIKSITREYAVMLDLKDERNIVRCDELDVQRKEDEEGYNIFIRMELLEPLHKVIGEKELTEQGIIHLAKDICRAISICESHGIIHRDIKPQNIFINKKGDYKLGDFGIAREMDHTTAATRTGTPPYMAPEMILGQEYGITVDIYALGILLYRLLNNNKLPFWPADHFPDMEEVHKAFSRRISGEPLPEPLEGSDELKKIVLKACAFAPEDRYRSADEMMADLNALTAGISAAADTDKTVSMFGDLNQFAGNGGITNTRGKTNAGGRDQSTGSGGKTNTGGRNQAGGNNGKTGGKGTQTNTEFLGSQGSGSGKTKDTSGAGNGKNKGSENSKDKQTSSKTLKDKQTSSKTPKDRQNTAQSAKRNWLMQAYDGIVDSGIEVFFGLSALLVVMMGIFDGSLFDFNAMQTHSDYYSGLRQFSELIISWVCLAFMLLSLLYSKYKKIIGPLLILLTLLFLFAVYKDLSALNHIDPLGIIEYGEGLIAVGITGYTIFYIIKEMIEKK